MTLNLSIRSRMLSNTSAFFSNYRCKSSHKRIRLTTSRSSCSASLSICKSFSSPRISLWTATDCTTIFCITRPCSSLQPLSISPSESLSPNNLNKMQTVWQSTRHSKPVRVEQTHLARLGRTTEECSRMRLEIWWMFSKTRSLEGNNRQMDSSSLCQKKICWWSEQTCAGEKWCSKVSRSIIETITKDFY